MIIKLGNRGLENSHQAPFPETANCLHCGGEARPAFSLIEDGTEEESIRGLRALWDNDQSDNLWPHDATAFTVYLCLDCLKPTTLFNQA